MKLYELHTILKQDKAQWKKELGKNRINFLFLYVFLKEYRITVRKRLCEFLCSHKLLFLLYCIERFLYRHVTLSNGCDIPSRTRIGSRWVVIGMTEQGVPVVGNNVCFGTHAVVIGNVTVADNCIVGAGAVVTKSTEPNGVYAGVPARRIKERV